MNDSLARFVMPWPPSNNANWRMGRTRQKLSQRVIDYRSAAETAIFLQRVPRITEPVEVTLQLFPPTNAVADADNMAKVLLDALVKNHVLATDSKRQVQRLAIEWCQVFPRTGAVLVELTAASDHSGDHAEMLIRWSKLQQGQQYQPRPAMTRHDQS